MEARQKSPCTARILMIQEHDKQPFRLSGQSLLPVYATYSKGTMKSPHTRLLSHRRLALDSIQRSSSGIIIDTKHSETACESSDRESFTQGSATCNEISEGEYEESPELSPQSAHTWNEPRLTAPVSPRAQRRSFQNTVISRKRSVSAVAESDLASAPSTLIPRSPSLQTESGTSYASTHSTLSSSQTSTTATQIMTPSTSSQLSNFSGASVVSLSVGDVTLSAPTSSATTMSSGSASSSAISASALSSRSPSAARDAIPIEAVASPPSNAASSSPPESLSQPPSSTSYQSTSSSSTCLGLLGAGIGCSQPTTSSSTCIGLLGAGIGCNPFKVANAPTTGATTTGTPPTTQPSPSKATITSSSSSSSLSSSSPSSPPPSSAVPNNSSSAPPTTLPPITSTGSPVPQVSQTLHSANSDTDTIKIIIGATVGGIALLAALLFFFIRRRRRNRMTPRPFPYQDLPDPPLTPVPAFPSGILVKNRPSVYIPAANSRVSTTSSFIQYPDACGLAEPSPSPRPDDASAIARLERDRELEMLYPARGYISKEAREVARDRWLNQLIEPERTSPTPSEYLPPYPRSAKSHL
ncbi:hypothetical protein BV22DRAFT_92499 [Leucogyrophana mollusca]|uniref:Uncharacterized protein n=1 Tax=Leucogyrophana mollusca TaxID=85980 RepID=A0ACB8BY03_9AGAM|nr:hypothetical protein BV22DRAFT_92499 [Leucogyrophana mollusca]